MNPPLDMKSTSAVVAGWMTLFMETGSGNRWIHLIETIRNRQPNAEFVWAFFFNLLRETQGSKCVEWIPLLQYLTQKEVVVSVTWIHYLICACAGLGACATDLALVLTQANLVMTPDERDKTLDALTQLHVGFGRPETLAAWAALLQMLKLKKTSTVETSAKPFSKKSEKPHQQEVCAAVTEMNAETERSLDVNEPESKAEAKCSITNAEASKASEVQDRNIVGLNRTASKERSVQDNRKYELLQKTGKTEAVQSSCKGRVSHKTHKCEVRRNSSEYEVHRDTSDTGVVLNSSNTAPNRTTEEANGSSCLKETRKESSRNDQPNPPSHKDSHVAKADCSYCNDLNTTRDLRYRFSEPALPTANNFRHLPQRSKSFVSHNDISDTIEYPDLATGEHTSMRLLSDVLHDPSGHVLADVIRDTIENRQNCHLEHFGGSEKWDEHWKMRKNDHHEPQKNVTTAGSKISDIILDNLSHSDMGAKLSCASLDSGLKQYSPDPCKAFNPSNYEADQTENKMCSRNFVGLKYSTNNAQLNRDDYQSFLYFGRKDTGRGPVADMQPDVCTKVCCGYCGQVEMKCARVCPKNPRKPLEECERKKKSIGGE